MKGNTSWKKSNFSILSGLTLTFESQKYEKIKDQIPISVVYRVLRTFRVLKDLFSFDNSWYNQMGLNEIIVQVGLLIQ